MARKTAFVNEMMLETLKQNQQTVSPIVKTIVKLDEQMKQILDDKSLNLHNKMQLYSQALQQYMNTKENLTIEHPPTDINPVIKDDPQHDIKEKSLVDNKLFYSDDLIIDTIPLSLQNKAKNLLKFIKNNSDLTWDKKGTVSYKGQPMQNSNIIDLVSNTIRSKKSFNPHGWQEFAHALNELNIPKDLIGNSKIKSFLKPIRTIEHNKKWENI